jgi:hypothetical protein
VKKIVQRGSRRFLERNKEEGRNFWKMLRSSEDG